MAKDHEKRKASWREFYARNREACQARRKAYVATHKAEISARQRAYRSKNADKLKPARDSYNKKYYEANREEAKSARRAYYAENKDLVLKASKAYHEKRINLVPHVVRFQQRKAGISYALRHPDRRSESANRRRAQKIGTSSDRVDYNQILKDSKGVCGICGDPFDLFGIHFDHIIPLSKGGKHTAVNLQATHARCNLEKGAKVG